MDGEGQKSWLDRCKVVVEVALASALLLTLVMGCISYIVDDAVDDGLVRHAEDARVAREEIKDDLVKRLEKIDAKLSAAALERRDLKETLRNEIQDSRMVDNAKVAELERDLAELRGTLASKGAPVGAYPN